MKVTLVAPRSRPEHLASIPAPEGCDSPHLQLRTQDGRVCVAERDPDALAFHAVLPALTAGEKMVLEAEPLDNPDPASEIACTEGDGRVEVGLRGSPLLTFRYGEDYPKPVINPILTPEGVNMLREPMPAYGEGEHPWQRGLTLMQGAVNGVDCWNERSEKGFGRTEQDYLEILKGPLSMTLASDNTWYEGDRPLMTDHRSYRLFDTPRDAAVLDIALTLKASHGPVTLGDTKEAGFLCIRVNPSMNASADGRMRNSYGATDETGCWSIPAHWMDYIGPVGEETAGFAIFDHPENFRYPTTWHVRGYGLFAPNCWMFKPDHVLAEGDAMTFRWRVVIHTGDTESADIPHRFLDYVDGPRCVWD